MGVNGESQGAGEESRGAVAEAKVNGAEVGVLQRLRHAGAGRGIRTEGNRGVVEGKQGHREKGGGRRSDSEGDSGVTV